MQGRGKAVTFTISQTQWLFTILRECTDPPFFSAAL